MITIKNVLVATDFGETAQAALEYGRHLARLSGARLHVLHVVRNVVADALAVEGETIDLAAIQDAIERAARQQLDALVTAHDRLAGDAKTVAMTSNSPAVAIVAYAEDNHIDLIVLGTHGRGGVAHLLMGSVAERVVRTAPCPVLTLKKPEQESKPAEGLEAAARA